MRRHSSSTKNHTSITQSQPSIIKTCIAATLKRLNLDDCISTILTSFLCRIFSYQALITKSLSQISLTKLFNDTSVIATSASFLLASLRTKPPSPPLMHLRSLLTDGMHHSDRHPRNSPSPIDFTNPHPTSPHSLPHASRTLLNHFTLLPAQNLRYPTSHPIHTDSRL